MKRYAINSFFWIGCFMFMTGTLLQFRFAEHLDASPSSSSHPMSLRTGRNHARLLQEEDPVFDNTNKNINASIVVQLSGEMGNNLNKIAMGRGLQLMAKELYDIDTNLILRHQEHPKWKLAKRNIQKCFPKLRQFDFQAGNSNDYTNAQLEQKLTLGAKAQELSLVKGGGDAHNSNIQKVLQTLNEELQTNSKQGQTDPTQQQQQTHGVTATTHPVGTQSFLDQQVRVPFIYADSMVNMDILDRYREDFIDFFQFDDQACCVHLPEEDESVFHFRNFQTELKDATEGLGFTELSPEKTATELFGHLHQGDKVAITTRFDNSITQQYVDALKERGLQVRVVAGQSGVADFCFMKSAQKELVGMKKSSFLKWAAYLSHGNKVRTYSLAAANDHSDNEEFNWKDEGLKARFEHRVFESS